jgi:hypothetical protein
MVKMLKDKIPLVSGSVKRATAEATKLTYPNTIPTVEKLIEDTTK